MVSGVIGISVFSLGVTFNYLVSMFYKEPVRQGLFGKPIFKTPIDQQFGWMGSIALLLGAGIGVVSLFLGITGWEITRLWFYLLGGAMLTLIGVHLIIYYILLRVLDELSQRELHTQEDLLVG
jgi:hypothetical protein